MRVVYGAQINRHLMAKYIKGKRLLCHSSVSSCPLLIIRVHTELCFTRVRSSFGIIDAIHCVPKMTLVCLAITLTYMNQF